MSGKWMAASAASFGAAVLLSQVRYGAEADLPSRFADLAGEEHGHETAGDAVGGFFEGRELANRLRWLLFGLGVLFLIRSVFQSDDAA